MTKQRFYQRPMYWFLVILVAIETGLAVPNPIASAQSSTYSQLGRKNYVINYGSWARIERPPSSTWNGNSAVFVLSTTYPTGGGQIFVQTGFYNGEVAGCQKGTFLIFGEWVKPSDPTNYHSQCYVANSVDGISSIYQETNNANPPYWCRGVNGNGCLGGVIYESTLTMSNGTYVGAYGETTNPAAVMGRKAPNWIHIRQVSYKATRTGAINNPITYAGTVAYGGNCAPLPATGQCPYNMEAFNEVTNGTSFLTVRVQTK